MFLGCPEAEGCAGLGWASRVAAAAAWTGVAISVLIRARGASRGTGEESILPQLRPWLRVWVRMRVWVQLRVWQAHSDRGHQPPDLQARDPGGWQWGSGLSLRKAELQFESKGRRALWEGRLAVSFQSGPGLRKRPPCWGHLWCMVHTSQCQAHLELSQTRPASHVLP